MQIDMPAGKAVNRAGGGGVRRCGGFTIVELMVTVAVAAILMVIAVPSFRNIINTNRLNTTANAMVGALSTARMEAVKRNGSVQFCSNASASNTGDTLGAACGSNTGAVYVQTSGTAATPVLAAVSGLTGSGVQLSGNVAAIRFNSQGQGFAPGSTTPYDGTVADICSSALSSNNHIKVVMATGTIVTTTPSTGACP